MSTAAVNVNTKSPSTANIGRAQPDAGPVNGTQLFQRPEWKRVFGTYGLEFHNLQVTSGESSNNHLPLVPMQSRAFGSQLVSLPWFDAAGLGRALSESDREELIEKVLGLADECRTKVVQVRESAPTGLSKHVRTDKVAQVLNLENDPDDLWKRLKAKVRNQVRKAEKCGLVVQRGKAELVDDFFEVYSRNMRDLGSPSHSKRLFEVILDVFPREATVYIVRHKKIVIGCGLTLATGTSLEIPWASSLREYDRMCVNHAMYWRILKNACEAGFQQFNFGRSTRDTGPYRYKRQWQPDEVQLHWYFLSRDENLAAAATVVPQEQFGLASRVWRRLPLTASRFLGPWIMAQVP